MRVKLTGLVIATLVFAQAGCATITPASRIEQRLVTLGLSRDAAGCVASGLEERLDRNDLVGVARFLDGLRPNRTAGEVVRSLSRIQNPRAAAAVGATALSCAFGNLS